MWLGTIYVSCVCLLYVCWSCNLWFEFLLKLIHWLRGYVKACLCTMFCCLLQIPGLTTSVGDWSWVVLTLLQVAVSCCVLSFYRAVHNSIRSWIPFSCSQLTLQHALCFFNAVRFFCHSIKLFGSLGLLVCHLRWGDVLSLLGVFWSSVFGGGFYTSGVFCIPWWFFALPWCVLCSTSCSRWSPGWRFTAGFKCFRCQMVRRTLF